MSQLKVNSIVPSGGLPAGASGGGIIQVVQTVKQNSFSANVSNSTFAAITDLSASITPSSTNSKILVQFSVSTSMQGTNGAPAIVLYKNGSAISGALGTSGAANLTASACFVYSNNLVGGTISMSYLDSPATTSSTSYQCYLANDQSSTYATAINRSDSGSNEGYISTITLMEITG